MRNFNFSSKVKVVSVSFGVIVFLFVLGFYIFAWTEPTSAPPGGTVVAPLNVGNIAQGKLGSLGIGVSNPASRLHIKDGQTWGSDLRIEATGGRQWVLASTNGSAAEGANKFLIKDGTLNQTRFIVDSNGYVGIGISTPTPTQRLDIGGNIKVSGQTIFNSVAYTWPLSAGSNGQVLTTNGSGTLSWTTVSSSGGGITAVYADNGLTGTATSGDVHLNVGAGTGISVSNDAVALDTGYTDSRYVNASGDTMTGDLNMSGRNITNVNKITVNTIDPLYTIGGQNYATFVPSMLGVKEEYTGKGRTEWQNGKYLFTIDFAQEQEGSDLWVWRQIVDFGKDNVEVIATPYGSSSHIYYYIEGEKIIFVSDKAAEFSFRLTGKRSDHLSWPTKAAE